MCPDENQKIINKPKPVSIKQGCIRGTALGCGVLIIASLIIGVFVYLRLDTFFTFGVSYNIETMQKKVNVERTLTDAQYYEISNYLKSLNTYMTDEGRSKQALINYSKINKVFKSSLKDGRFSREEIAEIRSVMLETNIPLLKQKQPVKQEDK